MLMIDTSIDRHCVALCLPRSGLGSKVDEIEWVGLHNALRRDYCWYVWKDLPLEPSALCERKHPISVCSLFVQICFENRCHETVSTTTFCDVYSNSLFDLLAEGSWDQVMSLIGKAHTMLHEAGVVRIQSDIRVGSRCVFILHFPARMFPSTMNAPILEHQVKRKAACRTDKVQSFEDKVRVVNHLLSESGEKE